MRRCFTVAFVFIAVLMLGLKILNPIGPSIIPVVGILENRFGEDLEVVFWKSVDEVLAHVKKKDVDIAIIPVSMGANLYNKGLNIELAAVTMWKAFYVIGTENVSRVEDLKGKEIYMPHSKGTTVDVMLRYMLTMAGIDPEKDVKLLYAPPQEIVALLKTGKAKIAAPPEPFVTIALKIPGVKILFDVQEEWSRFTGLPPRVPITGVFVLRDSPSIPSALKAIRDSLNWALENPQAACEKATEYLKGFRTDILLDAMKRSDYEYYSMSTSSHVRWLILEYLSVINSVYPKAMPEVPDSGFFYTE